MVWFGLGWNLASQPKYSCPENSPSSIFLIFGKGEYLGILHPLVRYFGCPSMYLSSTADFVKVAVTQQPFELQSMAWAQTPSFLMMLPLVYHIWFGMVWFWLIYLSSH